MKKTILSNKGLSILELAMTMVIVSLAALIVMPNIMDFTHGWDAENEAKKFALTLRELQQRTIAENYYNYGVQIDPFNDRYTIGYDSGGTFMVSGETISTENNVDLTTSIWVPSNVICFDLLGGTLVTQFGPAITFADSSGNSFKVIVNPTSGRIHIRKL